MIRRSRVYGDGVDGTLLDSEQSHAQGLKIAPALYMALKVSIKATSGLSKTEIGK